MADAYVELTVPGNFPTQDMEATVREELHNGADELGQLLLYNVSARTSVDTGALLADEQYTAYTTGDNLVYVFAGVENQLDQWGRIYALYQEGADLGLETYTNAPHEMFGKILTDDIPDVEAWGQRCLTVAMGRLAAGTGVTP
jgi:hypothetical protein